MKNLFQPGNKICAAGKPKGVKNRLAARVLADLLDVWDEPVIEGKEITRGKAALRVMSREKPSDFAKLYGSLVPKEYWVDNSLADMSDAEVDDLITRLRSEVKKDDEQQVVH